MADEETVRRMREASRRRVQRMIDRHRSEQSAPESFETRVGNEIAARWHDERYRAYSSDPEAAKRADTRRQLIEELAESLGLGNPDWQVKPW